MQVSDILSDIDFLCGTTSATYATSNKIRNVNIAYQDVARLIWQSAGGWQYDDSNATTLPIARASLVHNQKDYSLPSTAQRLERVEVKDSSGNPVLVKQMDISDIRIAAPEYLETAGLPIYYDLIGRSVMFYPTPSSAYCTLASGMALYVNRDVTEFPVTASSQEPGFATSFHRILSYAAALDFQRDEQERQFLLVQKGRLEEGLVNFYSKRDVDYGTSIKPRSKRSWKQYV